MRRPRRIAVVLAALAAAASLVAFATAVHAAESLGLADDLDRAYPAASIASRAQAEAALEAAARADRDQQARYDSARAECLKRFLVNHCSEAARRRQIQAQRIVLRVQVEAHDWERADDAARREADREQEQRDREAAAPDRQAHERSSRDASADRAAGASQRHADAAKQRDDEPAKRARFTERQAEHAADVARSAAPAAVETRADNVRQLQQKRDLAAQHAQQVAEDRKTNEARREERRKSLAADEERRLHPPARDD